MDRSLDTVGAIVEVRDVVIECICLDPPQVRVNGSLPAKTYDIVAGGVTIPIGKSSVLVQARPLLIKKKRKRKTPLKRPAKIPPPQPILVRIPRLLEFSN